MSNAALLANKVRSRQGCWTCRQRKVKCDEDRPNCQRCVRLGRVCDYAPRPRKKYTKKSSTVLIQPECEVDSTPSEQESPLHVQRSLLPWPHTLGSEQSSARWSSDGIGGDETRAQEWQEKTGVVLTSGCQVSPGAESQVPDGVCSSTACSTPLSPSDHAAIHCFRHVFSPTQDTKDPIFSVPAIVWTLAQRNHMVLHMVCALGGQELACLHRPPEDTVEGSNAGTIGDTDQSHQSRITEHYGAALRLLATAIRNIVEMAELDYILATLWLMIVYEQKHGDGWGSGLTIHLKGAGYLLQERLQTLVRVVEQFKPCLIEEEESAGTPPQSSVLDPQWPISGFSSRMIVWISHLDGGAAINGLGGWFNQLLGEAMVGLAEDEAMSLIQGFRIIHKHSHAAFEETWGASYPQTELLEDLEMRNMFYLYGECGQLRYLLSKLVMMRQHDGPDLRLSLKRVAYVLNEVAMRYADTLETASLLQLVEGSPKRRYVTNIRFVVAQYNAVLLCFYRIQGGSSSLNQKQRAALRQILDLAHQAHSDEGEVAMLQFTWPLFVAALESDDPVHRSWILERYRILCTQGQNYRRANEALKVAFREQRMNERRVDFLDFVRRDDLDRFVIC